MTIFNIFSLLGGLALFLYGMDIMGEGLKRLSGGKLESILRKLTSSPLKGVLVGLVVTGIIQSSSATTVMVVGFVNSGIMKLSQAVSVIMGANIGTTVTSWILSMAGIEGENIFVQMLEPSSFSPVLAFIGIILLMFSKSEKKNDVGTILLGFAVLMTGMLSMSGAVAPLADVPEFGRLMTMFSNPILGMIAGAVFTAIIQSSSASVGILQALCATGSIPYAVALPVIMGQNIGTCITAILSAVGANRNSKRTALIHLFFNVIGTSIFMIGFYTLNIFVDFVFLEQQANETGIAIIHSCFNIGATILLLPFSNLLVKLAYVVLPVKEYEKKEIDHCVELLDERFLEEPAFAVGQAKEAAEFIFDGICGFANKAYQMIYKYDNSEYDNLNNRYEELENEIDFLNDYLVKISGCNLANKEKQTVAAMLQQIGELKGIISQLLHVLRVAKKLKKKECGFSKDAKKELQNIWQEVEFVLASTKLWITEEKVGDENGIDQKGRELKGLFKKSKKNHIVRLQKGDCNALAGMAFLDVLSNCEQMLFHCTNIKEIN